MINALKYIAAIVALLSLLVGYYTVKVISSLYLPRCLISSELESGGLRHVLSSYLSTLIGIQV